MSFARPWVALLVLSIGVGVPAERGGDSHLRPGHALARKVKLEGVGNLAEVTPTLYRGSQPTDAGFKALAQMGVEIVVDLRGSKRDDEAREVERLGMKYIAIPWHCPFPRDEVFARFLKVIKENPGKKVFVHCRLGDDRGGMMIAAYRMAIEGWTAQEAMSEMQAFGFVRSHHFICPGLASYEKHFPEHLRKNPVFEGLKGGEKKDKSK
jgi:protein tyrosine phosphatase (PTP) superfamily phosphohydrolase (DUF442 family)